MPIVLGLGETFVALLLLMFVVETYPIWSRALSAVLGALPVVGPWAASNADALTSALFRAISPAVSAGFWPMNAVLWRVGHNLAEFQARIIGLGDAVGGALHSLAIIQLPALAQHLTAQVSAVGAAAGAALAAQVASLTQLAQSLAAQTLTAAAQQAGQLVAALEADILARMQALGSALAAQVGGLESDFAARLRALSDWLGGALADVRVELRQGLEGARGYTDAAIGVAAAALTLSLSRVTSRVKAIEDSPCQQNCDVLGNLGGELGALDIGLLLAAFSVMVKDPQGAAGALEGEIMTGFQEAGGTLAALLRGA